jgi:hypothetical protein
LVDDADLDKSGQVASGDLLDLIRLWHVTYPSTKSEEKSSAVAKTVSTSSYALKMSPIGSWNGQVYDTALALQAIARYVAWK